MKSILFCSLLFIIFSCKTKSTEEMILGHWEMKSWINLKNNRDLLKSTNSPKYKINFKKDSVFIMEFEGSKSKDYKFAWELKKDTISIKDLGNFKIDFLNDNELVLLVDVKPIFSKNKKVHKEEITLIRRNENN